MAAELEVQKALYTALAAIGLRVFDFAPQITDGASAINHPCVTVGEIVTSGWDTAQELGFEFVARIHTWSRSGSAAEAKGIQGQIYARLHRTANLTIIGQNTVSLWRETSDCMRAEDGSFHGVCTYRGQIETA